MRVSAAATLTRLLLLGIAPVITSPLSRAGEPAEAIAVESASATFSTGTNVPAVSVKGKSSAVQLHARMRRGGQGTIFESIEATLPVKTLATGMNVRDEHMRKYVFTSPDGRQPDLRFESSQVACPGLEPGREAACTVSGTLAIRGVPRSFSMVLKIKEDSGGTFRAAGDGAVKLSDYGIEQPSQFGVKTANEVRLHLDFVARRHLAASAAEGGRP